FALTPVRRHIDEVDVRTPDAEQVRRRAEQHGRRLAPFGVRHGQGERYGDERGGEEHAVEVQARGPFAFIVVSKQVDQARLTSHVALARDEHVSARKEQGNGRKDRQRRQDLPAPRELGRGRWVCGFGGSKPTVNEVREAQTEHERNDTKQTSGGSVTTAHPTRDPARHTSARAPAPERGADEKATIISGAGTQPGEFATR